MLDHYKDCPKSSFASGKFAIIDSMYYAEFLRYCYLTQIATNENDCKPEELTDDLIQGNHTFQHNYPNVTPFIPSKEKLKCCKIPRLLQYYEPMNHIFTQKTIITISFLCVIHSEGKKSCKAEAHLHIHKSLMNQKLLQLRSKIGD